MTGHDQRLRGGPMREHGVDHQIAGGMDAGLVGLQSVVDLDAATVMSHRGRPQAESLDVGRAACDDGPPPARGCPSRL
ncbi:MAG: hypothetical protein P8011_10480 [Acidihalobacter sp.]|uniref:hypothetical protein n=1 Tax=Acidihalobacter sp. TaxID=1872108 RepID=UPI00307DB76D